MAHNYLHVVLEELDSEETSVKTSHIKRKHKTVKKDNHGKRITLNRKAERNAKKQLQTVS